MTQIEITDVTLRDGLQMQPKMLSSAEKLSLYEKIAACPYQRLEITSFVHPGKMPQFADSDLFCEQLVARFAPHASRWMGFVPNARGLDRLLKFPIPWVSAFIATSETFNKKNINQTIEETVANLAEVVSTAHRENRKVRLYISTVFGCPYEGAISEEKLAKVFQAVIALKPDEIAISDTIGVATPAQVKEIVGKFLKTFPKEKTALHFHHTYGLALAAIQAGLDLGVRKFDGSTGGLGGCPYAKGASGNVPTEEVLYSAYRQGLSEFPAEPIRQALQFMKKDMGLSANSHLLEIWEKGGTLYGVR